VGKPKQILPALALWIVLGMLVAACGEKDEPEVGTQATPPTTTTQAGGPLVSYARTGGVAGIQELLTVGQEGEAKLELGFLPDTSLTRFQLSQAELQMLRTALDKAELEPGNGPQTGCADCFTYEITTAAGTSTFDQTTIPAGAEDLVQALQQIVEDNIPARAAAAGGGAN
jgi:hypothetical protein